jgi:hypothetical protein
VITVDADLVATAVPYLTAVATAYGAAVLERVRDEAADATADATVGAGRRLLRKILHRPEAAPVGDAVAKLATDPGNPDRITVLRTQLLDALSADPQLAGEVAALLQNAPPITASGTRSAAVGHNTGIVQTGDGASAWQQR